jgi:hypothetical protein
MTKRQLAYVPAALLAFNLLPARACAEGVSIDTANKAQISAATDHYERGVVAFDAGKLTEALSEFQQSNDMISSPNSRMMIGRTLARLGRLPEAYRELCLAIEQAGGADAPQKRYRKTVDTAQSELKDIKDKLAYVTLRFAESATIQGRAIDRSRLHEPQVASPGQIGVEVTFGSGQRATRELNLKPGEHAEIALQPPAQEAISQPAQPFGNTAPTVVPEEKVVPGASQRTFGYIAGAVGVVGMGAFVGFGIIAAASYGNTKATCTQLACPESAVDNQAAKSLFQGIGYAGLGIGVIGLGAGTWLLLSSGSSASTRTALQIGPLGAKLAGSF